MGFPQEKGEKKLRKYFYFYLRKSNRGKRVRLVSPHPQKH
tara:strand:+ start:230 stop:349 length:120 start_codon:yes stop_codon:yes gene_type:complete